MTLPSQHTPGPDHAAPVERITVSRDFTVDLLERAVKTAAQSLLAYFAVGEGFNAFHADWGNALGVAAGATMLSVLTSLASFKLGRTGTASATDAVVPESHVAALTRGLGDAGLGNGPA